MHSLSLRLRCLPGFCFITKTVPPINLLTHYAKGTKLDTFYPSPAYKLNWFSLVGSHRFRLELSLYFPSRYLFTIAYNNIFSLRGWCPYLQSVFNTPLLIFSLHCTSSFAAQILPWWPYAPNSYTYFKDFYLLMVFLYYVFSLHQIIRLDFFRSPLLKVSRLIYFPSITKMFQFIEFLRMTTISF